MFPFLRETWSWCPKTSGKAEHDSTYRIYLQSIGLFPSPSPFLLSLIEQKRVKGAAQNVQQPVFSLETYIHQKTKRTIESELKGTIKQHNKQNKRLQRFRRQRTFCQSEQGTFTEGSKLSFGTFTENEHYLKAKETLGKPGPTGAGLQCQILTRLRKEGHQFKGSWSTTHVYDRHKVPCPSLGRQGRNVRKKNTKNMLKKVKQNKNIYLTMEN